MQYIPIEGMRLAGGSAGPSQHAQYPQSECVIHPVTRQTICIRSHCGWFVRVKTPKGPQHRQQTANRGVQYIG
eukprot:538934-Pyramimonas_sp.AAC.1